MVGWEVWSTISKNLLVQSSPDCARSKKPRASVLKVVHVPSADEGQELGLKALPRQFTSSTSHRPAFETISTFFWQLSIALDDCLLLEILSRRFSNKTETKDG